MAKIGTKTERYEVRLCPIIKADLVEKAGQWGMKPAQYLRWIIEKDLYGNNNLSGNTNQQRQ